MTAPDDDREELKQDLHGLLLRLAGKAPDDVLTEVRGWLAEGRTEDVAHAVISAVVAQDIALIDMDLELLDDLLDDVDADTSVLDQVQLAEYDPAPPFGFSATPPGVQPLARVDDAPLDEVDRQVVAGAPQLDGVRGVWRVWRSPAGGSASLPSRRIYVVETDEDADLVEVTAELQRRLAAVGETDPQVETYPVGAELPSYQRLAKAYAGLIWASTPSPEIKMAAVFDEVDAQTGPTFSADHERLGDEVETRKVLDYLWAGEPLLVTTAQMDDVVDPTRRNSVPMNFRTDGTWIWTDTTTYYLEQHRLSPDPGLLGHIRSSSYQMPELDGVDIHRAMAVLQEPPAEEPVWTYDGSNPRP